MAIAYSLISDLPKPLQGADFFADALLPALERAFHSEFDARMLRVGKGESQAGDELYVISHPTASALTFTLSDTQVLVDNRTSSTGPGYHAAEIDALDQIANELGLAWRESDEHHDESGYFANRDFAALQSAHAGFLRSLLNALVFDNDDVRRTRLTMNVDALVPTDFFVASPMGLWEQDDIQRMQHADEGAFLRFASRWFPWWERERDERYWSNVARCVCWVDLPWHPPEHQLHLHHYQMAKTALERAGQTDTLEYRDIITLLSDDCPADWTPAPEGMGFRRGMVCWGEADGWSLNVPGYWREEGVDGDQIRFVHGERSIEFRLRQFDGLNQSDLGKELELLLESCELDEPHYAAVEKMQAFTLCEGSVSGKGRIYWRSADEGRNRMRAFLVAGTSIAWIEIEWLGKEHRDWAEAQLKAFSRKA